MLRKMASGTLFGRPPPPTLLLVGAPSLRADLEGLGFNVTHVDELNTLSSFVNAVVFCPTAAYTVERLQHEISSVRKGFAATFIVVVDKTAAENPFVRLNVFDSGTNMASVETAVIFRALQQLIAHRQTGKLACAYCGLNSMSEDALWEHVPLYHINDPNMTTLCPVCKANCKDWGPHYRHAHGPAGRGEIPNDRRSVKLYPFGLVVCRRPSDGKFLVVQEFANSGYWVPGGHVNPGEDLALGALRETMEEAGVEVVLKGVLQVEFWPHDKTAKLRVVYYAEPKDESLPPKTMPDFESVGAVRKSITGCAWVSLQDLMQLFKAKRLRGTEPLEWAQYLAEGGTIHPMQVLQCYAPTRR